MARRKAILDLIDEQPPASLEIEQQLLGSLLLQDCIVSIDKLNLKPNDFYHDNNQSMFEAMLTIHREGRPIDLALLTDWLKNHYRGEESLYDSIGPAYIDATFHGVANASNAAFYAAKVLEYSSKRQLRTLGENLIRKAANGTPADAIVDDFIRLWHPLRERVAATNEFPAPVSIENLVQADGPKWLEPGYIAQGCVTLMVGHPKAGKTTFFAHVLRRIAADRSAAIRTLVVSEEGPSLWVRRRDEVGLAGTVDLITRPFLRRPDQDQWERFVRHLARMFEDGTYRLLVLDTWSVLNPCNDENDSMATTNALLPLDAILNANGTALLIHHARKSGGAQGTASRGSNALTGKVDIILELDRFDHKSVGDTRRVVTAYSRFDETPPKAVFQLTEAGYENIGSVGAASLAERLFAITKILTRDPKSADEIREEWPDDNPPHIRRIRETLDHGVDVDRWDRVGAGKRGDPYRYMRDGGG